jgi:hypothetical protein
MRNVVVLMQTTLDNRIADAAGGVWEPFPWGDEEQGYVNNFLVNDFFRTADTWAMSRRVYEAVVPWWETVARGEGPHDVDEVSAVDRAVVLHYRVGAAA